MSDLDSGLWLGLDTSTGVSAGVGRAGEVLATGAVDQPNAHVEQLMPLVRRVVAEAGERLDDLAGIVVGLGPGPYTGLRVGIVTAQALAYLLDVPLKGVCSLDVLGLQYAARRPRGPYLVATDARRREVYWATYGADGRRSDGPHVSRPAELPVLPVVGPGALRYPDLPGGVADGGLRLDAGVLAAHQHRLRRAGTEPLYLRRPDAEVPTSSKSALPRRDS
ncbi:MAG: tRNA (adenosine(37)-N6)-threonylcarbamoyltransferase complex dimerization subunit type 1 TsaB [Actinomycetia bacterium]|nr:tRNA (adenosine(37)-N6)-threonylcarbamoyltransferase complex dimerization subunit type 1 TsaB [Actinomycetes bacterium]